MISSLFTNKLKVHQTYFASLLFAAILFSYNAYATNKPHPSLDYYDFRGNSSLLKEAHKLFLKLHQHANSASEYHQEELESNQSLQIQTSAQIQHSDTLGGTPVSPTASQQAQAGIAVTKTLYDFGKNRSALEKGLIEKEIRNLQIEQSHKNTLIELAQKHFNACRIILEKTLLQSEIQLTLQKEAQLKRQFSIGKSREIDLTQAQANLTQLKTNLYNLEQSIQQEQNELIQYLNIENTSPISHQLESIWKNCELKRSDEKFFFHRFSSPKIEIPLANIQQLPELKLKGAQLNLLEHEYKILKKKNNPELFLFNNYTLKQKLTSSTSNTSPFSYDIGIGIQLPLYDGGKKTAAESKALENTKFSYIETKQLQDEMTRKIHASWYNINSKLKIIELSSEHIKTLEKLYNLYTKDVQNGLISELDALQAILNFHIARKNFEILKLETEFELFLFYLKFDTNLFANLKGYN